MDLENLLKKCRLWNFFPGKICRQDLFAIFTSKQDISDTMGSNGSDTDLPFAHLEFLRKIVVFDSTCRIFKRKETEKGRSVREKLNVLYPRFKADCINIHPLDVSTAVFLCCDNVARQDLVLHLWGCKFAFPLIVKSEQLEPATIYLWPIKCLIARYSLLNKDVVVERPVFKIFFKTIGALRFSGQSISKSNILNMLISQSGKDHPVFFHRDLEGSVPQLSEVCQGMVEAMPVFNLGEIPCLYLNLRGNCEHHADQRKFIIDVSDVIVVVFSKRELDELRHFIAVNGFHRCRTFILIGTDLGTEDDDIRIAESLEGFCDKHNIDHFVVAYKGSVRFEYLMEISEAIKQCKNRHNLNELHTHALANSFQVDLNGICEPLQEADQFTNIVFTELKQYKASELLPIQGEFCLEWCKADIEQHKLQFWNIKENIKKYRENLELKKKLAREEQLKLINKNSVTNILITKIESGRFREITEKNGKSISKSREGEKIKQPKLLPTNEEQIFLRTIKLNIDEEMHESLGNIYKEYRCLFDQIALDRDNVKDVTEQFEKLDRKLQDKSISIPDFTREIGQMYEVLYGDDLKGTDPYRLLKAAVKLLVSGYPIEIMDGRSNYVSINWVKGVLFQLQNCIGNVRLKVITVVGIQSSGKSTLLNIMFGSQFAVGSGRCTRGACMHLVKVCSDAVRKYNVDYVLVIDTEGLFSTSTNMVEFEERDRKERELSTFVIGLSNVTLVNILGENLTYLKDILPISVHAFLRMELAGLNPKCKLIHRNVQKGSKDQLLHQTYKLESVLDEYTAAACNIEKVSKRRFRDIIQFDITKDVTYLPPLFETFNAQDIVTCAFSSACVSLKEEIMKETDAIYTLDDLKHHIEYLWTAIKRENFVYEFKNTIETKARLNINRKICEFHLTMRTAFQSDLKTFLVQVSNCNTIADLDTLKSAYKTKVAELVKRLKKGFKSESKRNKGSTAVRQASEKFWKSALKSFCDAIEDYSTVCKTTFCRLVDYQEKEIKILIGDGQMLRDIDEYIEQHFDNTQDLQWNCKQRARALFKKWLEGWQQNAVKVLPDLHEAVVDAIYTYFPNQKAKIDEIFEAVDTNKANIKDFLTTDMCTFWADQSKFRREEATARIVVEELHKTLLFLFSELSAGRTVFETSVFRDIVLKVRNDYRILYEIHAKPSFEIRLAISLCGEFIQLLKNNTDKVLLAEKQFLIHTEQYFLLRCAEIAGCHTTLKVVVNGIIRVIREEIETSVMKNLSAEIAKHMRDTCDCLSSKQTLILELCRHIIKDEKNELLPIYLRSFESGAQCWLSWLFDSLFSESTGEVLMKKILDDSFKREIKQIYQRLQENLLSYHQMETGGSQRVLKDCITLIKTALDSLIPVWKLRQFENDNIEESNVFCVINMILAELLMNELKEDLCKSLTFQVLETEEYDKLRYDTVQNVLQPLLGCLKSCPFCGEVCCLAERSHSGNHRPIMHRPVGLHPKGLNSANTILSQTCSDVFRGFSEYEKRDQAQFDSPIETWVFPAECTVEDNSFWKYIFAHRATCVSETSRLCLSSDIPRSWIDLDKPKEMRKLEELIDIV